MDNEIARLPHIKVLWNAETQTVDLEFPTKEFKTWDFVLGVLDMARQKAEQNQRVAVMMAMQQQAAAVAQEQRVQQMLNARR